jgi:L-cysteine/cystine lyase
MPRYFEVRDKAARLLGVADPASVTLTHSTTEGINIIARGLALEPGDEVVMTTHEHPGGEAPWQYVAGRRGLRIQRYELPTQPPDDAEIVAGIERLITPRTRVLMVSHVLYTNGLIMPVEALGRLAAERGLYYLIDGAHPVGQMPLQVEATGCSFYAASGHKWLCGPRGTGLLYVRPDLLERVEPLVTSYDPENVPHDVESFDRGATRLNFVWTNNLHDLMGLEAAIDFLSRIGLARVRARGLALTRRFRAGVRTIPNLRPIQVDEARSTPVTTLRLEGRSNKQVFRALAGLGYKVKEVLDAELATPLNAIRVCTHIFNTESQVDGLLAALDEVMRADP